MPVYVRLVILLPLLALSVRAQQSMPLTLSTGGAYGVIQTSKEPLPLASARVLAMGAWDALSVPVNPDGTFRFNGLREGPYSFVVIAKGFCQTNSVKRSVMANQIADLSKTPLLLSSADRDCVDVKPVSNPRPMLSCLPPPKENAGTIRLRVTDRNGAPLAGPAEITISLAGSQSCKLKDQDVSVVRDIIALPAGNYTIKVDPSGVLGHISGDATVTANSVYNLALTFNGDIGDLFHSVKKKMKKKSSGSSVESKK